MENSKTYKALAVSFFNLLPSAKDCHCPSLGINEELASRLTHLSGQELNTIASRADRFMTIRIDTQALEKIMYEAANDKEYSEMMNQFILNYATGKMMHELFGMHSTEFVARRRSVGLDGQGQHRQKNCDDEADRLIWKYWQKHENLDLRERYLHVGIATDQPLNVIHSSIGRQKEVSMKEGKALIYVNRSVLTLHTPEALELCNGKHVASKSMRRLPNIHAVGILLNKIWSNAKADDPYAEYTLIQIEKRLKKASDRLSLFEKMIERKRKRWKAPDGLQIEMCEALEPYTISFTDKLFNTPHAKLLLVLIARFDSLMRSLLSYRQLNIVENRRYHTLKRRSLRYIRAVMLETRTYQFTGVKRDDLFNKTKMGHDAMKRLGMIPLAVLKREERSEYGPLPNR